LLSSSGSVLASGSEGSQASPATVTSQTFITKSYQFNAASYPAGVRSGSFFFFSSAFHFVTPAF
jgi:hypothetical protein